MRAIRFTQALQYRGSLTTPIRLSLDIDAHHVSDVLRDHVQRGDMFD
jgi:hypothetical protein